MSTPTGASPRDRLAAARLYLCVPRRPDLYAFAEAVLAGGVDILQMRDKEPGEPLEAREEIAISRRLAELCHAAGALFATNDRADVAHLVGADVLHLGQGDLTVADARRVVGTRMIVGVSTHATGEVSRAVADPQVDYFCVGPTWPTPTKPGRPAPGLELTSLAARSAGDKPWFAIGGIDRPQRVEAVLAAGASRVVVVRALTGAPDPAAAARGLAERLRRG